MENQMDREEKLVETIRLREYTCLWKVNIIQHKCYSKRKCIEGSSEKRTAAVKGAWKSNISSSSNSLSLELSMLSIFLVLCFVWNNRRRTAPLQDHVPFTLMLFCEHPSANDRAQSLPFHTLHRDLRRIVNQP